MNVISVGYISDVEAISSGHYQMATSNKPGKGWGSLLAARSPSATWKRCTDENWGFRCWEGGGGWEDEEGNARQKADQLPKRSLKRYFRRNLLKPKHSRNWPKLGKPDILDIVSYSTVAIALRPLLETTWGRLSLWRNIDFLELYGSYKLPPIKVSRLSGQAENRTIRLWRQCLLGERRDFVH